MEVKANAAMEENKILRPFIFESWIDLIPYLGSVSHFKLLLGLDGYVVVSGQRLRNYFCRPTVISGPVNLSWGIFGSNNFSCNLQVVLVC